MKRLMTIIILMISITSVAQHTVTLTSNKTLNGKITEIKNDQLTLVCADSINVYKIPYAQVISYNAGNGIVILNKKAMARNINKTDVKQVGVSVPYKLKDDELAKAANILSTGIVISGIGILTAVAGPYYYDSKEVNLADKIKTIQLAGCGLVLIGTIVELSSISHFKLAGKQFSTSIGNKGVGISMKL